MTGRFLALCGWLVERIVRPLRPTPLRRLGRAPAVLVAVLLIGLAAAPIALPLVEAQPQDAGVQDIFDDAVTDPDGWVRLRGRLFPLDEPPTEDRDGPYALLIDGDQPLRAIVTTTDAAADEPTMVTGHLEPAAYGGRIGTNRGELADPSAAILMVRPGPRGNVLTAQPLPDDGGVAPAPVTIGGGWTSGRLGYVFTATESVPALVVRSEQVDATLVFARVAERDRVAALIAVDR